MSGLNDPERLGALERSGLMDSDREEAFDRLTRLASRLLGVPVSLVSLVDDRRQYVKSAVGLELRDAPLSHSFCQHVVTGQQPLIVTDAREDELLAENPAVRELNVIAYAGIPLITGDGHTLGSFCAIDDAPRQWSQQDILLLQELARAALTEIELRAAERATRRARDYNAAILASMREGFLLTRDGTIIEVNQAFCTLTGFTREELLGASAPYPFWAPEAMGEIDAYRQAVATGHSQELRTTYLCADGGRLRVSINTVAAQTQDGEALGYVSTIRDISEQERHEAQLEYHASRDSLTGMLNRRVFDEHLRAEIARARRHGHPLSVALLDLDDFKRINDRHGHPVGDGVLRETALRLGAVIREGEYIARIGGEEFGWILPNATAEGAHAAAERARAAVSHFPFAEAGTVTVSAGVCQLATGDDLDSIYLNADRALYEAKRAGRNRTMTHNADMTGPHHDPSRP